MRTRRTFFAPAIFGVTPTAAILASTAILFVTGCGGASQATTRADRPTETATAPVQRDPCADLTVRFEPDSTTVLAAERAALDALGDCARDEERSVTIACHASGAGTAEYAFALGDRLAHAVADLLAARGVTPDQMSAVSHGNALAVCGDDTPACHARNQRCDLSLSP